MAGRAAGACANSAGENAPSRVHVRLRSACKRGFGVAAEHAVVRVTMPACTGGKTMRIAIIGATGMIGHHTALAAESAGHETVVVHRASSATAHLDDLRAERRVASLEDSVSLSAALQGVDAVINCAGYYPTVPRSWRAEVAHATAQMAGFYRACRDLPLQKIVYLGAAIALPRPPGGSPGHADLRYSAQPADRNPYLQVKWALDEMAHAEAAQGLPVVIGIPSMTFGEHDYGPTTGRLIVEIASGRMPRYVRGQRNTIYAGDAGRGLLACATAGRVGQRYLLTGENTDMDRLTRLIAEAAGVTPPQPVALGMARLVSRIQGWKWKLGGPPPVITPTAIAVMSAGQHLDGSKAATELGYQPEVGLAEAIDRALAWFRAQGML